jgi:4-hydroxy-3-methylbut-2-enyl diphosphate reductase
MNQRDTGARRWWTWLLVSVAVIAADQLSKSLVESALRVGEQRALTANFSIVLAYNTGAAFSFLADASGWQRYLFTALALAASALMVWLLRRGGDRVYSLALSLILGGALGNLWDRLTLGKVVDFLLVHDYLPFGGGLAARFDPFPRSTWPTAHSPSACAVDPGQLSPASCRSSGNDRTDERSSPGQPARILRRRRSGYRDRRAGARSVRPIYVRHEVVHSKLVVDDLKSKGAIFVDELADVPKGSTVVFSAHGVSRAVRDEAAARGLTVFDATCPLVTKVHVEVAKMHANGREIVMIGHAGHPEVEGTMGQADGGIHLVESVADVDRLVVRDASQLAYVTQTTLSVDDAAAIVAALKRRFPAIIGPRRDDICYATQNRQTRSSSLLRNATWSSSSVPEQLEFQPVARGRRASRYSSLHDRSRRRLRPEWVEGKRHVGVTAGAPAPEVRCSR